MKRILALLMCLLLCATAYASEAPAIPQEAPSPAEMILGSLKNLFSGDDSDAVEEQADPLVPMLEVTSIRGSGKNGLEIKFRNNTDETITYFEYTFLTLNEDGSYFSNAETNTFEEAWKDTCSAVWYADVNIKPGKSITLDYNYVWWEDDNGNPTEYVSLKEYPVIACAVLNYTTKEGGKYELGSSQMVFRTTQGDVLPPAADSLVPMPLSAEDKKRAASFSMGYTTTAVPTYLADFYELPAGDYVKRVLNSSLAKSAGLQKGDVITYYGMLDATLPYSLDYCKLALADGYPVEVTFWRDGEIMTTHFEPPAK